MVQDRHFNSNDIAKELSFVVHKTTLTRFENSGYKKALYMMLHEVTERNLMNGVKPFLKILITGDEKYLDQLLQKRAKNIMLKGYL